MPLLSRIENSITRYFQIAERGSNIATELRGGLVTFLTMSYVLLANPLILSVSGIPAHDVVVGTAAATAIATFVLGVFGNLPFGSAPGLGLSAYISYGLSEQVGLSWETCLTLCFLSGLICLLFAVTGISDMAMRFLPDCIKTSIVVGMGLLIAFIGLTQIHLVVSDPESIVKLGDMSHHVIWLSFAGLVTMASLRTCKIKGDLLVGIIFVTVLYWIINRNYPRKVASLPTESLAFWKIDFKLLNADCIPAVLAFVFIGIFDVSGVMFGLSKQAGLLPGDRATNLNEVIMEEGEDIPHYDDRFQFPLQTSLNDDEIVEETVAPQRKENKIPGGVWGFLATAGGTMIAAALGCSPIIVHIESLAGISEGARTGLASLVVSILFALSLFLAPILGSIPPCATAPVLIILGTLMMEDVKQINWYDMQEAIPSFFTIVMMPFTFSIPNGIAFGLALYIVLKLFSAEFWYCTRKKEPQAEPEEVIPLIAGPRGTTADGYKPTQQQKLIQLYSAVTSTTPHAPLSSSSSFTSSLATSTTSNHIRTNHYDYTNSHLSTATLQSESDSLP